MTQPATPHGWWILAATALAFIVAVLGATVRLADAGLACPDWPGCYGFPTVSQALASPGEVAARWPNRPLHGGRAHLEMLHRYGAGALGLLVLGIAAVSFRRRRGRVAALALLALLGLQALLGMWTVTLGLRPIVVVAHLLGGLAVLSTLWWMALEDSARNRATTPSPAPIVAYPARVRAPRGLTALALAGLALLAVQIALGGWTSANHAELVCHGFPTCNGAWWPAADFAAGFLPADGAPPSGAGLLAIHWTHRLGALAVLAVLGTLALATSRARPPLGRAGLTLGALLALQVALGIGTVLAGAPLPLAAAHNATAALLLLTVLTLSHRLARGRPITGERP